MSNNKLGTELAFPINEMGADRELSFNPGMSKRLYIACAAMQGILNSQIIMEAAIRVGEKTNTGTDYAVCKMAYEFADELLKQEQNNNE
jgi:hypothetical protein